MGIVPESSRAGLYVTVRGRVQGVGFRHFIASNARRLGLTGYVRNLNRHDRLELVAEGRRELLEGLLDAMRRGPPGSRVDLVEVSWGDFSGNYSDFRIELA